MKRIITASILGLLAPLLWFGAQSPAEAVTYDWEGVQKGDDGGGGPNGFRTRTIRIDDAWGRALFMGDRDEFFVLDLGSDGMRVGMEWRVTSGEDAGRWGLCYSVNGNNFAVCDKAIHRGRVIARMGRCDGDVSPCGKPGTGSGWKSWTGWRDGFNDAYNRAAVR